VSDDGHGPGGHGEDGAASVEVVDDPDRSRYQASIDGTPAGFAAYRLQGDHVVFTHTEVDPAFEGKGVGSALARAALDDVRSRGLGVVAMCPFVSAYIRRHPEYGDLLTR
jgi:predicted GNAT family acetyltransferase